MQIPASNLRTNRFHRLVGNCRAEIDEVLPFAILRSPRPKRVAQKIELLVRVRPSPILILAIDNLRLFGMKLTHTPSSERLWPPEPPGLPLLSYNARWHHRRNAQTAPADIASPSTDQTHNAETDWVWLFWNDAQPYIKSVP